MTNSGRSEEATSYRKWYKTARWRKRRAEHLAQNPLCVMCQKVGILNDGSRKLDGSSQANPKRRFLVCDHVRPHRGDEYLFYFGEVQTLCPDHHDIVKQREETRGYSSQVDASGWPIDPNHPSNR